MTSRTRSWAVVVVGLLACVSAGCGANGVADQKTAAAAPPVASASAADDEQPDAADADVPERPERAQPAPVEDVPAQAALQQALDDKAACQAALQAAQAQGEGALAEELKEARRRIAALRLDRLSYEKDVQQHLSDAERARKADARDAQHLIDQQASQTEAVRAECRSVLADSEQDAADAHAALAASQQREGACQYTLAAAQQALDFERTRHVFDVQSLTLQVNQQFLELRELRAAQRK